MTTEEKIKIMTAWLNGVAIQCKYKDHEEWHDLSSEGIDPMWCWSTFDYRIKTEVNYRPYQSAEEFIHEYDKHGHYIFDGYYHLPVEVYNHSISFSTESNGEVISYEKLLNNFKWRDGSKCGIKIND